MSSYDELFRMLDNGFISLVVLRKLPNEEHVTKVEQKDSDKWQYNRYDVYIDTGELCVAYVKKPLLEILKLILHKA